MTAFYDADTYRAMDDYERVMDLYDGTDADVGFDPEEDDDIELEEEDDTDDSDDDIDDYDDEVEDFDDE